MKTYEEVILQAAIDAAKGRYDSVDISDVTHNLAVEHQQPSSGVIRDMFRAYAEHMADDIVASRMALVTPNDEELKQINAETDAYMAKMEEKIAVIKTDNSLALKSVAIIKGNETFTYDEEISKMDYLNP